MGLEVTSVQEQLSEAQRALRLRKRLPVPDERRRRREAGGLTQSQLAEIVGVSRSTISRYEAGLREAPRDLDALDRYVQALDALV
jgi:predicted transcriptional regulator